MKSAEIREAFLKFFESKGHEVVGSSSLIPGNDPTLLFTNAGMVQFKDVFLGEDKRPYARAASSQRCVRAGGKHNDLENVGYTARHHTFFEMLGNFSFGDYFKREAIQYAWEFLTQVMNLPEERLWVTVHISDDEAADIWLKEVGVSADRFSRLDEDNFWQMGDTGPCGPSSEIFYDHGEDVPGGPPGSENDDLDRYIEIWNLVFMQYERQTDGSLVPLPKPSVDTGMGLERIAAVMQGVHSNYEIDLFRALLKAAAEATNTTDLENKSLRVIADHIRSCAFLICDGVMPSNEGRGYVLRRIIRRAIRHGHKLGQKNHFFNCLVSALVEQMGEAYPELAEKQAQIVKVLLTEEEQFAKTLDKGMTVLEQKLAELNGQVISGETVFLLYDTYGFPADLTNDIAREKGLTLDLESYEKLMEEQKKRARESGAFKIDYTDTLSLEGETEFVGYQSLSNSSAVTALIKGNQQVDEIVEGDEAAVVLSSTAFYGESGGQVGDTGYILFDSGKFEVRDCQKSGGQHIHLGVMLSGKLSTGEAVNTEVSEDVRQATALNHSATHLLHAALREVLGEHVTQKGSLVDSEKLRFDFSHFEAVSLEQLAEIETIVNQQIRANTPVETKVCSMDEAKQAGAMALFGEKYGETVRVLSMGGGFSVELCGGTHVSRTGDIGLMHIVAESGIAAGVRRIEAYTGEHALNAFTHIEEQYKKAASVVKAKPELLVEKLEQLVIQSRALEKEIAALKGKLASASADDWLNEAQDIQGIKVLVKTLDGADPKSLRDTLDQLKNKLGSSVVVLATASDKVSIVAGVSKDVTGKVKAGDIMKFVAPQVGGKGGGRPDMAQGGGTDIAALPQAMASITPWLQESLES
ncbi:alanine--tRNA ligase [Teredinibacter sp. KSP-S5-2]|uniref:alanine--tRNA ligase n=1 Tax=Teredinibacter sp. KSP-S5-2 TaxID=3034506 RepID=UPI0029351D99|nr:alanine--tRNA ligase [Teredinibacter sp. KSP-S5-2]WNO10371.1 alanine--tRNA ligase [Teredinibacter sp. KSP-S5-2]